jgi:GNAT superfamily N-acetyltransferase
MNALESNLKIDSEFKPVVLHAEPVLAVADVEATVNYWHNVLGFPYKWTWGEPANHGGVSWNNAFIQFSLDPKLAAISDGHSVWIKTRQLKKLFEIHRNNGADIVVSLTDRPWGMREYAVKEINGYYLYFSEPIQKDLTSAHVLSSVKLNERKASLREYILLCQSVGWVNTINEVAVQRQLDAALFTVVAENEENDPVGCAFLFGDGIGFAYIKDVAVLPEWQRKGIGSAMMNSLNNWAEKNLPDHCTIALFTGDALAPFYRQFGFMEACGMYRQVKRV